MYDVVVIGGGPAGMMAAIFAAQGGSKVAILEKNPLLGKKLLATGNGRCNISNSVLTPDRYHGSVVRKFSTIYSKFNNTETRDFFEKLGVSFKEEDNGRLFPVTDKASTVVEALLRELKRLNVDIFTGMVVKNINKNEFWEIKSDSEEIIAKNIVIATGGKAAHKLGSSGDGLFWAKLLGHANTDIYAALVPVETVEKYVVDVMGIKLLVEAKAILHDTVLRVKNGDMLFTHYGLSGPAIMGIAGAIAPYVGGKENPKIVINFFPNENINTLDRKLLDLIDANPKKTIVAIVFDMVPLKLAKLVISLSNVSNKKGAEISKNDRRQIIETLTEMTFNISKIRPLREAQVTAGGISVEDVKDNLESKIVDGLYFVGEILDVDGDSGGFNLQWAWSSGAYVGKILAKEKR